MRVRTGCSLLVSIALVAAALAALLPASYASATCPGSDQGPRAQPLTLCRQYRASTCCSQADERSLLTLLEPFLAESRAELPSHLPIPADVTPFVPPASIASDLPSQGNVSEVYHYTIPPRCRTFAASLLCSRCAPPSPGAPFAGVCVRTCQDWLEACAEVLFEPPQVPGAAPQPCAEQSYELVLDNDGEEIAFIPVTSLQAAAEGAALASVATASAAAGADAGSDLALAASVAHSAAVSASAPPAPLPPRVCVPLRAIVATGPELCSVYGIPLADPLDTAPAEAAFAKEVLRSATAATAGKGKPARIALSAVAGAPTVAAAAAAGASAAAAAAVVASEHGSSSGSSAAVWGKAGANDPAAARAAIAARSALQWQPMSSSGAAATEPQPVELVGMSRDQSLTAAAALADGSLLSPSSATATSATAGAGVWALLGALRDSAALDQASQTALGEVNSTFWADSLEWRLPRQEQCWSVDFDSLSGSYLSSASSTVTVPTVTPSLAVIKSRKASAVAAATASFLESRRRAAAAAAADAFSPTKLVADVFSAQQQAVLSVTRAVSDVRWLPRALRLQLRRLSSGQGRWLYSGLVVLAWLGVLVWLAIKTCALYCTCPRRAGTDSDSTAVLGGTTATGGVVGGVLDRVFGSVQEREGGPVPAGREEALRAARAAFLQSMRTVPAPGEAGQPESPAEEVTVSG